MADVLLYSVSKLGPCKTLQYCNEYRLHLRLLGLRRDLRDLNVLMHVTHGDVTVLASWLGAWAQEGI